MEADPIPLASVMAQVVAQTAQCAKCTSAVVLMENGETCVRCPNGAVRPVRMCVLLDRLRRGGE